MLLNKLFLFQHQWPLNPVLCFPPPLFCLSFLWKLHGEVFHKVKCRWPAMQQHFTALYKKTCLLLKTGSKIQSFCWVLSWLFLAHLTELCLHCCTFLTVASQASSECDCRMVKKNSICSVVFYKIHIAHLKSYNPVSERFRHSQGKTWGHLN